MNYNVRKSNDKLIYNKNEIVKRKYIKNNYFAVNFSGDLCVPIGEMLHYVHSGFKSIYENYLILTLVNGMVKNKYNINTIYHEPNSEKKKHISRLGIDFWVPINFSVTKDLKNPLININQQFYNKTKKSGYTIYSDSLNETYLSCFYSFCKERPQYSDYIAIQKKTFKDIKSSLSKNVAYDTISNFQIYNKSDEVITTIGIWNYGYDTQLKKHYGIILITNGYFRATIIIQSISSKDELIKIVYTFLRGVNLHLR
jgi:hypothetical protein